MKTTLKEMFGVLFISGVICASVFLSATQAIEVAQVEPAKVRLIIPAGTSKSGTIKIYNLSKEPKKIKAYL